MSAQEEFEKRLPATWKEIEGKCPKCKEWNLLESVNDRSRMCKSVECGYKEEPKKRTKKKC